LGVTRAPYYDRHDVERSFAHPRYELVATGQVFDGADAVRGYYFDAATILRQLGI
jgi:hypothetical protein